jgi:Fic family protein
LKIPHTPPDLEGLIQEALDAGAVQAIVSGRPTDSKGRYLHWEELRHKTPPEGLTHRLWWGSTSWARNAVGKRIPLVATDGRRFRFSNVEPIQEMVHRIDQQASGQILADDVVTNLRSSDRYLVSSLIEEAITSSQLEGASTTRRVAKEMLATGRPPRDRDELMIANNFQAMTMAQELAHQELTSADVLELHRVVTEGTLDDPADAGRLQLPGEDRVAVWWHDGTLLHRPPPAEQLPDRLAELCRFANGESTDGFMHPVVRAIIVHFWLAYDHPFADGNGRTARALFYWAMLHNGYWLAQYLSVSSILRKARSQYTRSYLYTETDGYDITYFVIYQLQVLERAIASLHDYLTRKIAEQREIEGLIHGSRLLNHRQLVVVRDALRDPGQTFTIAALQRTHRVVYQSARSDLLGLETLGLLLKERIGKKYVFRSVTDLPDRLRGLGTPEVRVEQQVLDT